jgi:hypothetical protein
MTQKVAKERVEEAKLLHDGGSLTAPPGLAPWEVALMGPANGAVRGLDPRIYKLSMKGNTWKIGPEVFGDFIDLIIGAFAPFRAYYDRAYDATAESATGVCWATAQIGDSGFPCTREADLRAHPGVVKRQSTNCSTCRFDKFGTALSGGRGKACPVRIKVAVLVLGGEKTGAIPDPMLATVAILDLPPTAKPAFANYLRKLQESKYPYFSVVTRVSFDPDANWSSPVYDPLEQVPDKFKERARSLVEKGPELVTTSLWPLANVPDDRGRPSAEAKAEKEDNDVTT